MKNILVTFALALMLVGCGTNPPKVVEVPVWTPPTIIPVEKPVLISDGKGTNGEVARKLSVDLTNVLTYVQKLENQIKAILNAPAPKSETKVTP